MMNYSQVIQDATDVLEAAFDSMTEDHCNSLITHYGYNCW